jgi:N-acetylmuramoyl-L-alanine amidase
MLPATAPPPPPIVRQYIPFGARRKREMAAYARRHYGIDSYRLTAPKVIVEHIAVAGSTASVRATFAPDRPDPELHELPGTCSHYVVGATGTVVALVPLSLMCRHTVGLNYTAVGIEHVGFRDGDVLGRPRELAASLALTQWLRCRFRISVANVIGHNESLTSPYHRERVARLRTQTHGDWVHASMVRYRAKLRRLGPCPPSP